MPIINLPEGNTASFPDDMPKEQIERVLQQHYSQKQSTQQPQQGQLPNEVKLNESGPVNTAAGIIGGINNATASTVESAGDAGIWAANKLGKFGAWLANQKENTNISDKDAETMKANLHQTMNSIRSSSDGDQSDPFNRGMSQSPAISKGAEYTTDAANMIAASPGNVIKAGGIGRWLANSATKAGVNSIEGAGIAGGDQSNQDTGALIGGIASPIADLISAGASKLATKATLTSRLQKFIQPIIQHIKDSGDLTVADQAVTSEAAMTSAAIDQNKAAYAKVEQLPGQINAKPIIKQAQTITDSIPPIARTAENKQVTTLATIQQEAQNMKNMEDAVKLRQYIASNKSIFQGQGVTNLVYKAYNDLKAGVDNQIGSIAEANNAKDAFAEANTGYEHVIQPLQDSGAVNRLQAVQDKTKAEAFNSQLKPGQPQAPMPKSYSDATKQVLPINMTPQQFREISSRLGPDGSQIMQNHLIQKTLGDDILSNPNVFDQNAAVRRVNSTLNKFSNVLSTESKSTLQGLQALLKEGGATGEKGLSTAGHNINNAVARGIAGGGIGGTIGGRQGGGEGAVIGGTLGAVAGTIGWNATAQLASKLLNSPTGQKVLQYISKNPSAARALLQPAVQAGPAALSNNANNDQ